MLIVLTYVHDLYIFAASALGVKEMLPPYLNKSLTLEDLKTGVSFASAGSGYNNATCKTSVSRDQTSYILIDQPNPYVFALGRSTGPYLNCGSISLFNLLQSTMTMERQLQLFAEYKAKVGSIPDRALFIVCSGSNDIVEHFTLADGMSSPDYADMMAARAISFVEVHAMTCTCYDDQVFISPLLFCFAW